MKKTILPILLFFTALCFWGCERELTSEGLSDVTYYPVLEMAGDPVEFITKGTAFSDAGVTAEVDGVPVDVVTTGTVDENTLGIYTLTYKATNDDGYSASIDRLVIVYDDSFTEDFSGEYQRTKYGANTNPAGISTWTKLDNGLYEATDPGGVGASPHSAVTVFVIQTATDKVMVAPQPSYLGGTIYCSSEAAGDPDDITFTDGNVGEVSYEWSVLGAGFGTAVRTFSKVE